MIRYNLICDSDHEFEGWFSSSSDYDQQAVSGLLSCPVCSTKQVEKAIMAPAVKTARKAADPKADIESVMNTVAAKIRHEIEKNCEHVGTNFAKEARAIHYGEKPERAIYGSTTPEESAELKQEGIEAHPLPDAFVPGAGKTKLN